MTSEPVEELHANPWFAVRKRHGYYTVEHHLTQVVVLPLVESRAAVMVRVPRPVLGATTLELPAGSAEKDETPVQGAAREFSEETGITVAPDRLVPMRPIAVMPNRTPDLVHPFRVDLSQAEFDDRKEHDSEVAQVELVALERVPGLIQSGAIFLALPVALLAAFLLSQHPAAPTAAAGTGD